jgi:Flp pilus assembly protein TadG
MRSVPLSRRVRRRGAIAAQAAVCFTALLGVAALALDGGLLMLQRRYAQATADAAALAAAAQLYNNRASITNGTPDPGGAGKTAALAVASANGYNNNGTTNSVTVNIPPQSGNFKNTLDYAEVIVTMYQPRRFSVLLGSGNITIRARAVACESITNWGASILTLRTSGTDSSGNPGLIVAGNSKITVPGPVLVDSSSSSAAQTQGSKSTLTAPSINVVGGYTGNGFTPTPTTGASVTSDPLSGVTPPGVQAAPSPTPSGYNANQVYTPTNGQTLPAGNYYGINITSNVTVTLGSGTFSIGNGGFSMQSPGSTVTGSGVLLYQYGTGTISLRSGVLSLTPPTSGTYQGINIWQDSSDTSALTLEGNGGTSVGGMIYAPSSAVTIAGGSNITPGTSFISSTLTVTGGGSFTIPQAIVPVPNPHGIRGTGLVE